MRCKRWITRTGRSGHNRRPRRPLPAGGFGREHGGSVSQAGLPEPTDRGFVGIGIAPQYQHRHLGKLLFLSPVCGGKAHRAVYMSLFTGVANPARRICRRWFYLGAHSWRTAKNAMMYTNKQLLQLSAPRFAEQFLIVFVGVADTFMVSYAAGEAAVSGVALVDTISFLDHCRAGCFVHRRAVVASQRTLAAATGKGRADRPLIAGWCPAHPDLLS